MSRETPVVGEQNMKIVFNCEINQSPELVFPWIEDPGKAMQWQKDVKSGQILENKPEIIGTTFEEIIEEDGNSLPMHGTITKYTKNKLIGFRLKSNIHEFDVTYAVEGIGTVTRLSIDADIHWKFPMNVMSLILRRRMEEGLMKQMELEVEDLKKLCERA
jgi:uncharacterized protein YndB with AHSA1/START domain